MSEVEIRTLRPDEVEQFVDLSYYAFYGLDGATREDRAADYRRQDIPERHALVAVEDGRVVAEVVIFALGTWIRGVRYPTGGIANVATAPQKVRRGHARRLLEHALAYMRDELGLWISTLYPTVYPLYRPSDKSSWG
jgi:predicted acetyltransferase